MLLRPLLATICLLGSFNAIQAAITWSGNIHPIHPAAWSSTADAYVGRNADGTLTVDSGSELFSGQSSIGHYGGVTGAVTVNGSGSWGIGFLDVGSSGTGLLNVTGGGAINVLNSTSVGTYLGSTGAVTVDGSGSTWYNRNSYSGYCVVGNAGSGAFNVTGGGIVRCTETIIGSGSGSTGVVTVNGNLSLWANDLNLTVGHHGKGALNIIDGGNVNSMYGEIGSSHGSGVVTVDGAYSTWHIFDDLFIGKVGSGVLDIAGGGGVINYGPGFIGFDSGSTGVVTVNGSDSSWHNGGDLKIGGVGKGTLNITSGGRVSATNVLLISSQSLLAIDVGNGSSVTVGGTGWIDNSGTVRISATANAAAGVYTPIIAGSWSGSGTYQALGGTWNTSTHQFTVSTAQSGASGETVVMALSAGPRVVFDDAGETGWSVGASFAPTGGSGTLSFAATTISGSELTSLETLTGENQSVLGGWEFTAGEGYTQGSRVYLTFDVGEGFSANGLQVWHSHDGSWSPYAVSDLTYDGRYASFTVTGFSGYAVTTVPEPSTLALLAFGSLGLIAYAWRRRRRWEQIGADRKTCSPAD